MSQQPPESIEDKYKKLQVLEHLLLRPHMYVGDINDVTRSTWVVNGDVFEKRSMTFNAGIMKMLDEIIVNACDHARDNPNTVSRIEIEVDSNRIMVRNDGPGIPVKKHKTYDMYVPELVFSQFMTSTNYNDAEKRYKGGTNGLGAKIASALSTKFTVTTACGKEHYSQTFEDHLSVINEPVITPHSGPEFTRIEFFPDMKFFNVKEITASTIDVMHRRAYDLVPSLPVNSAVEITFNGKLVVAKSFKDYVNMYLNDSQRGECEFIDTEFWRVAICSSATQGLDHMTFVNGVNTARGGPHLVNVLSAVTKAVTPLIDKNISKGAVNRVKPSMVRDNLFLVAFTLVKNPDFGNQAKDELITAIEKPFKVTKALALKVSTMDLAGRVMAMVKSADARLISASDASKRNKRLRVDKLDDASAAGTKDSHKCTLILTEGDSAKTFAVSGMPVSDFVGIYPLRGKFLNVRKATLLSVTKSKSVIDLKSILGLKNGKTFKSLDEMKNSLRYGRIMIICDQDTDGFHIKGLILNFLHHYWPDLLDDGKFVCCLKTPLVKAFPTRAKKNKDPVNFYSMPEFNKWYKKHNKGSHRIKYYKGLGTSSSSEAKECFKGFEERLMYYSVNGDEDRQYMELAFNALGSDERKEWIREHSGRDIFLNPDAKVISAKQYVNEELVQFSIEDCSRSIPSMVDGFKPSQRKVLFGTLEKKTPNEIKVDQLRGFIAGRTSYHHGDASMSQTIMSMNHDFVGSNNINCLVPCGQLGTRLEGGADAASARYVSTRINPIASAIFSNEDDALLNYLEDDGQSIEPEFYYPVIPMILVNGAAGIGTGFACSVPKFNPLDIIDSIRGIIKGETARDLVPWYRGFTGTVKRSGNKGWVSFGKWKRKTRDTIVINELPVGVWTERYKTTVLDKLCDDGIIKGYRDKKTDTTVCFEVTADVVNVTDWTDSNKVHAVFSLKKSISSNLTLFDENGTIHTFDSPEMILMRFYQVREPVYARRYENIKAVLEATIEKLDAKNRFVRGIIDKSIVVQGKRISDIESDLTDKGFPAINGGFEYLLSMRIASLSMDLADKLDAETKAARSKLDGHLEKRYIDLWKEDLDKLEKLILDQQ